MLQQPGSTSIESARDFLLLLFQPHHRIALTLVHKPSSTTVQRTALVEQIVKPSFQRWLRFMNAQHHEIYYGANPLDPRSYRRTKLDIAEVRHLYLDFDIDGTRALHTLYARHDLPQPNYVVLTSPHKFQVIWKLQEFTTTDAELLMRLLARDTGADIAATDVSRVLRLPGFRNHKYNPSHAVTARSLHDAVSSPADFPRAIEDPTPLDAPRTNWSRLATTSRDPSPSGRDWRLTLSRLRRGADPADLVTELAAARRDKPQPRRYAERTVRNAQALIEQTPTLR